MYAQVGEGASFDKLGLYLAALVSLDYLITRLRPVQLRARESSLDETAELCAQLLHLELKAAEAYPTTDLLMSFQMSAT